MNFIDDLFSKIWFTRLFKSIIVVVAAYLLYKLLSGIIIKAFENKNSKLFKNKKVETYARLIRSINKYVLLIVAILVIMEIYEINVTSIVAGVGIMGAIFGLAIQDWLKDIIRGSSILSDDYFSVGDVVKYKDIEGQVLVIGMKTTKIKDLVTSNIISIANRNIEEIQVVSNLIYVKVPMPYEVNLEKSEKAIGDILKIIKDDELVETCTYRGITELGESSINYLIEVSCSPIRKLQVRRNVHRAILKGLEANKIEVPYNQLDIHQK